MPPESNHLSTKAPHIVASTLAEVDMNAVRSYSGDIIMIQYFESLLLNGAMNETVG